jgi:hypothetical protein
MPEYDGWMRLEVTCPVALFNVNSIDISVLPSVWDSSVDVMLRSS